MKKILAIKNGITKLSNVAKFVKVLFNTIEYFKEQLEETFPDDKETLKLDTDVKELS